MRESEKDKKKYTNRRIYTRAFYFQHFIIVDKIFNLFFFHTVDITFPHLFIFLTPISTIMPTVYIFLTHVSTVTPTVEINM